MVAESKKPLLTLLTSAWRRLVKESCLLWPDFAAEIHRLSDGMLHVDSPRAGGRYAIGSADVEELWRLDNHACARLTTWLVNERRSGVSRPVITSEEIGLALESQPLPVVQRADRLLGYIEERIKMFNAQPAPRAGFLSPPSRSQSLRIHTIAIGLRSGQPLAWSESVDYQDISRLFDYLREQGWVTGEVSLRRDRDGNKINGTEAIRATVTAPGSHRLENLNRNADSRQAFVAMWFDSSMDPFYDTVLKPAIESAGYTPYCVNRELGVDKIIDTVKEEISRSRFLVADVTHGHDGARGSVYYEIGYAHALGLEVLFTCHESLKEKLVFDISQHLHLFWNKDDESKIRDRIAREIRFRFPLHD